MSLEELKKVGENKVIEIPRKPKFTGNFSKVYIGRFDKKEVAVKRVDRDDKLAEELDLLRDFQHANIVRYLFTDVHPDEDFIYIVLEKCQCTLREFINEKKHEIAHLRILWQVTCGLDYLHEVKGIIHRDLKPCNVLMDFRECEWVAKLSDFGISKKIDPNKTKVTQTSIKGTIGYFAPETLRFEKIDKRADIFALGIIFHYVLSDGEHPFGDDNLRIEADIRDGKIQPNFGKLKPEYVHDATSLILSMIAHNREDRLYITQVMAHHLFWDAEKKLGFVQEVSDHCINNFETLAPKLEVEQAEIVGDWRQTIHDVDPVVKDVFVKMRAKKQKDGVCDLLRNIRNLKNHFKEKPDEFRDIVGTMPDGLVEFFTSRFPKLLPYVYDIMKCCSAEFNFQKYYEFKGPAGIDLSRSPPRPDGPGRVMRQDSGYQDLSEDEVEKLELRKYQSELAAEALSGSNSLIVAPTGCGKTAVVAGIIQEHLSKQTEGRVMFMVPKTALAHQQYSFLRRYLPYSVECIIGELASVAPPGQKMLETKVTVLTAQILINELRRKPEESYISFDKLSMLVFDECHNATKKHPYKQIMDLFLDYAKANPKHSPIQIVGVTASPGVGKAKDRTEVKENLLELLANLDITTAPSVVEKNLVELKEHQNEIQEDYIRVQTETEFGDEVMEVMKVAEEQVKKINEKNDAKHLNRIPKDRYRQAYESWTYDLQNHAKMNMRDQEAARILMTYAEHLKMYNILLQLKNLVPNAMKHTNKMVTFQQEGFENKDLLQKNRELLAKATDIKVPMLDRLLEIIQKKFRKNPDARCIVFVKRKLTAKSLEECIAQHKDTFHLNPKYLIGSHDTDTQDAKITKNEQENVLKAFRDGETKVVIATSVAEEGLDIKECNLVIMYNYVTGEVGRIQRRGRGRAADSRAILLTPVDSNHLRLEEDNKIRAQATEYAMKDVKKIPPEELEKQIRDLQEHQRMERKRKHELGRRAIRGELPSKWEIICAKCRNFLTTGDKLRHIEDMHIVVKDPKFDSRVIRQVKEQKKGPNIVGTADFLCNNPKCGIKVALEMVYKQSRYPTLSIRKVLMRKEDGKVCDPKKRMNMPFTVTRSIDESDDEEDDENQDALKDATESLGNLSLDDDENLPSDNDQRLELLAMMQ